MDQGTYSMFIEQMNILNFYFEPGYMSGGTEFAKVNNVWTSP